MLQLLSLPYDDETLDECGHAEGLSAFVAKNHCDGLEVIWGGRELSSPWPNELVQGYHLTFYSDWLDFYLQDEKKLLQKFGEPAQWERFYGGKTRGALLACYAADIKRAVSLGARYLVFHVADNSIEESYTWRWEHTDEQVIDAACEVINTLLGDHPQSFEFLVENLWWPGFSFTKPGMTERLLSQIRYPKKGIMLDTGHLMNTNREISSETQGCTYIIKQLKAHGTLTKYIRGIHLHQSLSGAFANANTGGLPPDFPSDYIEQFCASYRHIGQIDTHQPFTAAAIREVVSLIDPAYLVHEIAASSKEEKERLLQIQQKALGL